MQNVSKIVTVLEAAEAYILHVGCNFTEKGLPHPQQLLLNKIEDVLNDLRKETVSYGSLDDGVPNHFDHTKRGFQPK